MKSKLLFQLVHFAGIILLAFALSQLVVYLNLGFFSFSIVFLLFLIFVFTTTVKVNQTLDK